MILLFNEWMRIHSTDMVLVHREEKKKYTGSSALVCVEHTNSKDC